MKKLFIFIIFITIVFTVINVSAMTYNDFIEAFPNDYIYRIDYPTGYVNYISSPAELQFEMSDKFDRLTTVSGKYLVIKNPERVTYHILNADGNVINKGELKIRIFDYRTSEGELGFEGDIDIYIWSGYGFFLPLPSQMVTKMGGMMKIIMMTAGFGILSLVVLVKLLKVLRI